MPSVQDVQASLLQSLKLQLIKSTFREQAVTTEVGQLVIAVYSVTTAMTESTPRKIIQ